MPYSMADGGMTRMATGGMTPGGIVYMQEGRAVPGVFSLQHQLPGLYNESGELKPGVAAVRDFLAPRRAQFSVIREAEALRNQGRLDEAIALLRSERIDPSVLGSQPPAAPPAAPAAAPAAAPGPVDFMAAQRSQPPMNFNMPPPAAIAPPQAAPQAAPPAPGMAPAGSTPGGIVNAATASPGNAPTGGVSSNIMSRLESVFKPQQISQAETDLINLLKAQQQAGIPAPLDLTPFQQAAEKRQQEALSESRRMAIANTLMGLGTGLVAGDPAAGLQRATQMATETLREGRREAREEGRSAEALRLQAAQQSRQAQIEKMQFDRESLTGIANIYRDRDKSARESQERALQIMATYDAAIQNNISRLAEQGALDRRAFLSALSNAEENIEDALTAQLTLTPEEKDRLRKTLRERAIRQLGASIPGIDVEAVIKAGRAETAPAAQSRPPLGSVAANYQTGK